MLKKTITFKDLEGNPVTKDFYFYLSKANLVKLKMEFVGDADAEEAMEAKLEKLRATNNAAGVIAMFDRILELAYGVKDEDGVTFLQSPGLFDRFTMTDAYSELFMELMGSPTAGQEFIIACLPSDLGKKVSAGGLGKLLAEIPTDQIGPVAIPVPVEKKREDYTEQELMDMSWAEFHKIFGKDVIAWDQPTMVLATNRKLQGK